MIKLNKIEIGRLGEKAVKELLNQMRYVKIVNRWEPSWMDGRWETIEHLYIKKIEGPYWTHLVKNTEFDDEHVYPGEWYIAHDDKTDRDVWRAIHVADNTSFWSVHDNHEGT